MKRVETLVGWLPIALVAVITILVLIEGIYAFNWSP